MSNSNQAEEKEQSRPKRRAAKNISSGSYLEEEYGDSPMSEDEREDDDEMEETKEKGIKRRIGRPRTSARNIIKTKKFPKIKLRMIRGSEENAPIFLAQSMDEVGFCGFVICC